jgi:hypothetical protein
VCVDDFGEKFLGQEHAQHLQAVLEAKYKITTDWSGVGLTLDWDYKARADDLHAWLYHVLGIRSPQDLNMHLQLGNLPNTASPSS